MSELEYAAKDTGHDLADSSHLLRPSCPDAQPYVNWSVAEVSAVAAWYRIAAALETAKKQPVAPIGYGERLKTRARIALATTTTTTCESRHPGRGETCRSSRKGGG